MKLLIATHTLMGRAGAALHTVDLCRGFRRAGHDVAVFALQLGDLSDALKVEGFAIFSLADYRSLSRESFDLVYLHHATTELVLGSMFGGKVPIVRGYLGKRSRIEGPTNGNHLSGALYLSEGVRATVNAVGGHNREIPSMIARNVYDERSFPPGMALKDPPRDRPNFAVVTNHLERDLRGMLEEAAGEGLCSFTHFGCPDNNVSISAGLLVPFDAVITIFRTVLPAAAMGLPVYMSDVGGADGWLASANYHDTRDRSFSGRRLGTKDWDFVQRQLLDIQEWPTTEDLVWLSEQVEQDHALYRRVEQLEGFFSDIIEKAPPPVEPPEGYSALFQYIDSRGKYVDALPGDAHRVSELAGELQRAREKGRNQAQRIRKLLARLEEQENQN